MKAIVAGLGSMGKRRIRLLKKKDRNIVILGVDAREDRRREAEKLYDIKTYDTMGGAMEEGADCVFVCTSPLSHAEIIAESLRKGLHTFTEINLVPDKYEENIRLSKEKGCVLFLSSTFLYRDEIEYIGRAVERADSLLTYSYHVGQYLPDWHPWEKYTEFFIGDVQTNGCREIMAIEFPWLFKVFGNIVDVHVRKNKKTALDIKYDDSYVLSVEHENGTHGVLLIDVVSRKAVRNFEVFGEDLYLTWDGTPEGIKNYNVASQELESVSLYTEIDRQEGYEEFIVENAYLNEINAFFDEINCDRKAEYGFEQDREILALIDKIENYSV